ncbi:MAG: hypothetical protein V2J25_10040 [Desulfatiglans sp.]|jgi:hypothetical protein|nr:hypothetical protein [Thermodesulfobacteriota bacterium]MEE4353199.1 hypothetical protein [Desulfatiglans sp.]
MEVVLIVLILAVGVFLWFWFAKRRTHINKEENPPVYVCTECGSLHCNCYLEKEEDQEREGKSDGP